MTMSDQRTQTDAVRELRQRAAHVRDEMGGRDRITSCTAPIV